jgi:hypothetical protein
MIDDTTDGGPARTTRPLSADPGGPAAIVYEPAAVGDTALIPHEKVDRTPAALQHLEAMLADFLSLDAAWLVSLLGALLDKGSVALFGEVRALGHGDDFRLYRVVSYDSGTGKFTHVSRIERADAERLYGQRVEELS